ncbi:DUF721 domain-containing protein [Nocardioides sp. GXZ039]|uniref:DUF721 domain-containing protein n=1 Tax=Nocardioides sp. GXZ039 TaxID=3136018 RepID=UPI0030F3E276
MDDGLDLARQVTRAAASSGSPAARRRRRRPTPTGTPLPDDVRSAHPDRRRGAISGAHPDERDPQLLESEVARLVGRGGWDLPLRMRGVFARWPELVGDDVAGHCTPESFVDGVLVVRTDSTAWATQLTLLTPTILGRLNADLGSGTVRVLEVRGPHLPTWKKGRRSTRDGRGPRDTYG